MTKRLILLTLAYFATGWLGLQLPFVGTHITLVWLPAGIAVAALFRWSWRVWPGVYLGAFLVNFAVGSSWLLAAAIGIGNTLGPLLSAAWLKRAGFHAEFDRRKDVGLLVAAAGMGMALSALGGVTCLSLAGMMPLDKAGTAMLSWWIGDTVGVLLAAPLLLTLTRENLAYMFRVRLELLFWLLAAGIVAWFALIRDYDGLGRALPLAFLTMPLLTWAGLRFGITGAALAGLGFSVVAAWSTSIGQGSFILPDVTVSQMMLWTYMATTVLMGLLITALQAERLKMERDLRLSTEGMKDAQRIAHMGSWRLDLLNNELTWSDEIYRLFEIDANRFQANYQAFLDAIHPDDRETVHKVYTESLERHMPYEITHRLLMSDGRVKWVHERGTTDFDAQGNPLRSYGTVQDITELRRAEESLRKLSLAVEQSPSSIVITDLDGNIEFANEAFFKTTGYSLDEAIGQNPRILKSGKTPDSTYAELWATLHRGAIWQGEFVNRRKDGSEYVEWALISPIHQADGRMTHYLAIKDDITQRKQAETALRASHQQMYSLLNSMAEGAYGVDTEGRCRFVNRSFLRLLGYEHASDIIGKSIHELIHHTHADGRHYPEAQCRMSGAYLRNENVHVADEVFWRHDGTAIPVEYWSQPIVADGVLSGAIATFVDITERKRIEARLADSESRWRTIIENEPECIKIVDAAGRLVQMNSAGLKMLEADSLEQVVGCSVFDVIAPEYRNDFIRLHERVLAGETVQLEYEVIGLKGGRRWLDTHAVPMKEADGNIVHLAVTRDISERKQADAQLRIAATVFEAQEGMVVTDADHKILRVNKAFTDITGYTADEVIGKNPSDIVHSGRQDQDFYDALWEGVYRTGSWQGEIWHRRKNGEIFPNYVIITAVRDHNGAITHFVCTHTDITHRKAAAEEIERLAFYDPLTQLPNRRLLQDRLKGALVASQRSGRRGALLFIDLDNFKTLNDTLGHDMGDLLLVQVAERLSACVREGDTVARLGGDEFVVMLQELSEHPLEAATQAESIGNKIKGVLNQPYTLGEHDCISTPSIGATLFLGHERTVDALLKNADIAMYQAKSSGRNALRFFDPRMQDAIAARFLLENDLRKAVSERQFQLYYQLQVDSDNQPLGAEALIRWHHPHRGLLAPAEFIPLAEETGLILPIGQWLMDTACAQLKAWQQNPLTRRLALSVNVSAKQFFQANFAAQVQLAIHAHAIDPALLKLELTESVLVKNIDETIVTMNALGDIGVQFSLDDFGTGYSSLQYIKKLPLNQLKIDQSFVRDIADDGGDRAIVRTIIAMAERLNLNVIAEGVETRAQRQFLLDNGCVNYQGYLFGKPLPLAQFEALLGTGD